MNTDDLKEEQQKSNIDQPVVSSSAIKPPIGLRPKWVSEKERFIEVCGVISRYHEAGLKIPIDLVVEYNELVYVVAQHYR